MMTLPSLVQAFELCGAAAGLGLAALLLAAPRFGPVSVFLVCLLAPLALAAGAAGTAGLVPSWPAGEAFLFAYSLALLAAPAGLLFSLAVARADGRAALRARKSYLPAVCAAAPLCVILLHLFPARV